MRIRSRLVWVGLAFLFLSVFVSSNNSPKLVAQAPATAATIVMEKALTAKVIPFLDAHCNKCHNSDKQAGGVPLDIYKSLADARKDRKMWETIQRVVANNEMPPKKQKQPAKEDRAEFLTWIDDALVKVDCVNAKDPGRVTLRRLNRAEYNNTIRDLCGVNFKPADNFPSDDVGYGFDNIGDVLSVQPVLLEKYMTAADSILDQSLVNVGAVASSKQSFRPQNLLVIPRSARTREQRPKVMLTTEGAASLEKYNFPATGEYIVRVKAWGLAHENTPPEMQLRIDGKDVKTFIVTAPADKAEVYEITHKVETGERRLSVSFKNPTDPEKIEADEKPRTLGIELIEVEGPLKGAERPLPASAKLILVAMPTGPADARDAAQKVIAEFARRAFRRPVKPDEITRLMKLFDLAVSKNDPFETAIKLPLKAILVSPHFLFRIEPDPQQDSASRKLNDFELATRLAYFLWSSMPDDSLYSLAQSGQLRKPAVLKAEIDRMLKDAKSQSLVDNFAGQWLQLRNIRTLSPDTETFKSWDESLRNSMIKESELFFDYIVKNDRSILEFLDADYTFINNRMSWHYGIPNISGPEFRYVKLTDKRRGGIVTQASVLMVTSNPTRTSPVKRGKWVYENILGLQPPPPAPDVPELPPVGELKGTLRQQMEQHRANATCMSCHSKLDPLGFGLENFDAIGAWRDQDNKQKIDATGILPDGAKFDGPEQLRQVLLSKADLFRKCLAEKLLTYALGRGLEYYDKCVLDEIGTKLQANHDKFSALVMAIVESDAFQMRKGKRSE